MGFYNNTNSGLKSFEGRAITWIETIMGDIVSNTLRFGVVAQYNYASKMIDVTGSGYIQGIEIEKILQERLSMLIASNNVDCVNKDYEWKIEINPELYREEIECFGD